MSLLPSTLSLRSIFAGLLSMMFFGLAGAICFSAISSVVQGVMNSDDIMQVFLKCINNGIIALAVFELAVVIDKEYGGSEKNHDVVIMLRRTLPRFVGTVCVALVLEGLIMIIKYSTQELAGNLVYPVAIITSAALLIASLGVFLKLSAEHSEERIPATEKQASAHFCTA